MAVDGGAVTLTGALPTRDEWELARRAVLSLESIHALADDIEVRDARSPGHTDSELASLARAALRRGDGFAPDSVVAEVRGHDVTLLGTVRSASERMAAERAVIYLPGLTRIFNRIRIERESDSSDALV